MVSWEWGCGLCECEGGVFTENIIAFHKYGSVPEATDPGNADDHTQAEHSYQDDALLKGDRKVDQIVGWPQEDLLLGQWKLEIGSHSLRGTNEEVTNNVRNLERLSAFSLEGPDKHIPQLTSKSV